jgi:hypothetical protein
MDTAANSGNQAHEQASTPPSHPISGALKDSRVDGQVDRTAEVFRLLAYPRQSDALRLLGDQELDVGQLAEELRPQPLSSCGGIDS